MGTKSPVLARIDTRALGVVFVRNDLCVGSTRPVAGIMQRIRMEELPLAALDDVSFDARVAKTPGIDHFCSSSAWVLPAHRHLMPEREPWSWRGEHGDLLLARGRHERGFVYVQALEAAWGFASCVVGEDLAHAAREAGGQLAHRSDEWDIALITGLGANSVALRDLARALAPHTKLRLSEPTLRHHASLIGGFDAYLGRRSANFRASLKKAQKKAERVGITFEPWQAASEAAATSAYERILAIEAHSWKGLEGSGLISPPMREHYRELALRLGRRGNAGASALWGVWARQGERDVGFIFAARFADTLRALQCSFDERQREVGLGNLLQAELIQAGCAAHLALYDLGSEVPYKERFAEDRFETACLVAQR